MRLFTAIDIPAEVQRNLRGLLDRLRPAAKIAWSTVEKLHVTTKFIGEWPENRLEEMKGTLQQVCSPSTIEITVRGLGWFPDARNPRVFWAGVESGPELAMLAHATESAVEKIGVPVEQRKYSPHLTLARIRDRVPLGALRSALEALPSVDFGSFQVPAFYLYLSSGGKYTKLAEFVLT
ncbi:MAG TPA: RNA 2',3'-cyclic phosphodiesterase [Bryobacteraceae bacterium]|jgi:2'-5' RNA ligase|nr:RNA 2',3'-cyclic phosphodiesterase [Bryobacteraceae bacterium]